MVRSAIGVVLVITVALSASGCGDKQDQLSKSFPGKHLIALTSFHERGGHWDVRAYFQRGGCLVYQTPTSAGGACMRSVPSDTPAEARIVESKGREAFIGLARSDVAAVRYRTRYGAAIAETRRVPRSRLRYFLVMHDAGVTRDVLTPTAVDSHGQRVANKPSG